MSRYMKIYKYKMNHTNVKSVEIVIKNIKTKI